MRIFFDDKKLLIMSTKTIHFDASIEVNKSLKHEIKSIVSRRESSTEYTIKNEINQLMSRYKHEYFKTISSLKLLMKKN